MEIEVKEVKKLTDGLHYGKIVAVEYREKPYEYTDVVIEESEKGLKLKTGWPTSLTPVSKLGRAMVTFGASLAVGDKISPESVFVGKGCSFMTMEKNGYANVVAGSLKPVDEVVE